MFLTTPLNLLTNHDRLNDSATKILLAENDADNVSSIWRTVLMSVIFGATIFAMIFGNLLVILAIMSEKDLRRTQYYLILSLAVADLLVGLLVTPFAAWYEVNERWALGVVMCDLWTGIDVMACTCSILHLVAIALDR